MPESWLVWMALAGLGVLGVGLVLNGVSTGGSLLVAGVLTPLVGLAYVWHRGGSAAQPLVALGLIALLGGYCAVRLRPYVEQYRAETGERR